MSFIFQKAVDAHRDSLSLWIRFDRVGGQTSYTKVILLISETGYLAVAPVGRYDDNATGTVHRPFVAVADAHLRVPLSVANAQYVFSTYTSAHR